MLNLIYTAFHNSQKLVHCLRC